VIAHDDVYTDETSGESRPITPADPARLRGIGRRLHDTAAAHGQVRIAWALLTVFGRGACPVCGTEFAFADQVLYPARCSRRLPTSRLRTHRATVRGGGSAGPPR